MGNLRRIFSDYWKRDDGVAAISTSLLLPTFIFLTGGGVEASYAYYQWNTAQQAARMGLRVAVTTAPVAKNVHSIAALYQGSEPGDPIPYYNYSCNGKTRKCTGSSTSGFDNSSFNRIFYGSGGKKCATKDEQFGICDIVPKIKRKNVDITYTASGLGKVGNPADPKPFVTVKISKLSIDFAFLSIFLGKDRVTLPDIEVTALAEDLKTG